MKLHNPLKSTVTPWTLIICYIVFLILSWVLVLRDPRAIIGIGNLYPILRDTLFALQAQAAGYGINSIPTILFICNAALSLVVYLISFKQKINLKKTIIYAAVFQIITFLSFPILSTDIFSYIMSERVSTTHNQNIWQVKPAAFPDDQYAVLADWKDTTSVYGAVHYLLYLPPSLIGQNDLVTLVLLFKIVPAVFAVGLMIVFYKLLLLYKAKDPALWLRVVFWNPLFILEIFGSGHNDSMMLFFTMLAWLFYLRRNWLVSGVVIALAVQIKLIPIVLFFFCLLSLIINKKLRSALVYALAFFATNTIAFLFMQTNAQDFLQRVAYNGGVYWQSLPNVLQSLYPAAVVAIPIIFVLWVIGYTLGILRKDFDPLEAFVSVLLVYLLFVSSAYWNWYVLWIFPFIVFIKNRNIFILVLLLTCTSLLAYPLLWIIHRINTPSVVWPVLQYVFVSGTIMAFYLLLRLRNKLFDRFLIFIGINNLIDAKPKN